MKDVHARELLEHFARHAARCTAAAKGELAGVLLGKGHQVAHALVRRCGVDHQHLPALAQAGDGREVFHRVVRELFVQVLVGGVRGVGGDEDGVAIGRGLGHGGGGDHAAGTGLVVHHHGLLGVVGDGLADGTGQLVGGAACGKRHHKGDGLGRKGLGGSGRGDGQGHQGTGGGSQRVASGQGKAVSGHVVSFCSMGHVKRKRGRSLSGSSQVVGQRGRHLHGQRQQPVAQRLAVAVEVEGVVHAAVQHVVQHQVHGV